MTPSVSLWLGALLLGLLPGCAVRPVNEPIKQVDRKLGYRLETRAPYDSALARAAANVPNIEMFAIEISFEALADAQEREYLMNLTTSFELPPEAVDRLRAAAGRIVRELPDFQALVRAMGVPSKPVSPPPLIDVR